MHRHTCVRRHPEGVPVWRREDHLQSLQEKTRLVHALDQELRRRDRESAEAVAQLQSAQAELRLEATSLRQQLTTARKVPAACCLVHAGPTAVRPGWCTSCATQWCVCAG